MKFRPTCFTMAYCSSVRYVSEPSWNEPSCYPRPSASAHSMHESVHLIWIDSRFYEHSSQTHSSCGPACLRFASRIISIISKSSSSKLRCVRDKILKKDDRKAYPEVAPHCPLSGYIHHIGCKSVVVPASGRRGGTIAPSYLTRVVQRTRLPKTALTCL
jgi:hypothetical protein